MEWINDTEATLDMAPPISVDLQALDQQISEHRVFASDIDAHKARVTSLADQCQENAPGSVRKHLQIDRQKNGCSITQKFYCNSTNGGGEGRNYHQNAQN